ncbi:hypothetical protein MOQ_005787 [Trypanosoma cruzi marinkellei]|uniref:Uncharacterized protein n=1 Tax=Trypanosoma cruzi marinkellei TaxID=85056 RepID=K2NNH6_TRYCR|nr:hypothetical protein MOQ_005787 [Trypanosoma cruzi marinkellei]
MSVIFLPPNSLTPYVPIHCSGNSRSFVIFIANIYMHIYTYIYIYIYIHTYIYAYIYAVFSLFLLPHISLPSMLDSCCTSDEVDSASARPQGCTAPSHPSEPNPIAPGAEQEGEHDLKEHGPYYYGEPKCRPPRKTEWVLPIREAHLFRLLPPSHHICNHPGGLVLTATLPVNSTLTLVRTLEGERCKVQDHNAADNRCPGCNAKCGRQNAAQCRSGIHCGQLPVWRHAAKYDVQTPSQLFRDLDTRAIKVEEQVAVPHPHLAGGEASQTAPSWAAKKPMRVAGG